MSETIRLDRLVPVLELETARLPIVIVLYTVNEMRRHFRPIEDLTCLSIRREGPYLHFIMSIPEVAIEEG